MVLLHCRWGELWLNEGLATYLSYVAVDQVMNIMRIIFIDDNFILLKIYAGFSRVQNGGKVRSQ